MEKGTKTAHTQGPWKVDEYGLYIFGPNMEMVAEMRGDGANLPIEANGPLIAAAPDLLLQIRRYRAHHNILAALMPDGQTACDCKLCQQADEFIKAATGTEV